MTLYSTDPTAVYTRTFQYLLTGDMKVTLLWQCYVLRFGEAGVKMGLKNSLDIFFFYRGAVVGLIQASSILSR